MTLTTIIKDISIIQEALNNNNIKDAITMLQEVKEELQIISAMP